MIVPHNNNSCKGLPNFQGSRVLNLYVREPSNSKIKAMDPTSDGTSKFNRFHLSQGYFTCDAQTFSNSTQSYTSKTSGPDELIISRIPSGRINYFTFITTNKLNHLIDVLPHFKTVIFAIELTFRPTTIANIIIQHSLTHSILCIIHCQHYSFKDTYLAKYDKHNYILRLKHIIICL